MNYRDLELKISKESHDLYCASALENGSTAASHAFESRSKKKLLTMRHFEKKFDGCARVQSIQKDKPSFEKYRPVFMEG